jgi:hypothetical protein
MVGGLGLKNKPIGAIVLLYTESSSVSAGEIRHEEIRSFMSSWARHVIEPGNGLE